MSGWLQTAQLATLSVENISKWQGVGDLERLGIVGKKAQVQQVNYTITTTTQENLLKHVGRRKEDKAWILVSMV